MSIKMKVNIPALSIFFLSIVAPVLSASAQTDTGDNSATAGLEEIIVTAQKRTESLQDVPLSVTVIEGRTLQDLNISEWRDMIVPGVYIGVAGDTGAQYIRGVGTVPLERGFEAAVPVYSDGMYYGHARHNQLAVWDIENIEILKGPQPTHVGKNAIGGAILVNSARPTEEFETDILLGYEFEAEEFVFDGVISGPLTDGLNARLAVKYRDMGGWATNIADNNTKVPQHDDIRIRGSVVFEPRDEIEIYAKFEYADLEQIGGPMDRFNCSEPALIDPAVGNECSLNKKVTMSFDPASAPIDFFARVPIGDQVPFLSTLEHKAGSVIVNWDFENFLLTSNTGYYEYDSEVFVKPDFNTAAFPIVVANTPEFFDQFSQEIRLVSTREGSFDWLVGAYFDTSDFETNSYLAIPVAGVAFHNKLEVDQDSWAVFGELIYHVNEQFAGRFGARYTDVKKDGLLTHRLWFVSDTNTLIPFPPAGFALPESRNDSDFQPAVTLEWTPNDGSMYYASWKEGFKAGGFAINGAPPSAAFEPETVTAWEIGAKYTMLDGAATLNLAAFRSEYEDLQVSTFDPSTASFLTRNAEESLSKGIEFEFAWAATDELTLQASGIFLDAKYVDFSGVNCFLNPAQTPEEGCDIPPGGTVFDGVTNLAGLPLPYSPDFSASLSLNYEKPVFKDLLFKGLFGVFYTDEYHITSRGDKDVFQDAFTKLDLRIAIAAESGKWEVAFVGRNLTDELTAHMIEDTPVDPTSNWANLDRPRQLGIQFSFRL